MLLQGQTLRDREWKGGCGMIRIFRTSDGAIREIQEPQDGCWIALTNPTATEIFEISERFQIEVDDLRAPLDEEERSRIEVEDTYTLILVDVPMIEERNEKDWYGTIPLGIIVTDKMIFTICLEDTQVLTRFMEGRVRNFFTYMKTRFILQILYRNASMYLRYLRIIESRWKKNCIYRPEIRNWWSFWNWKSLWCILPRPFVPMRRFWRSSSRWTVSRSTRKIRNFWKTLLLRTLRRSRWRIYTAGSSEAWWTFLRLLFQII